MSLSSSDREKLYIAEAEKALASGRGNLPICNICDCPIDGKTQRWHESHDPLKPKWLGGDVTGIAHAKCNNQHNNTHDTPIFFKTIRQRQKNIGAHRSKSRPLPGTVASGMRKRMDGTVERRS